MYSNVKLQIRDETFFLGGGVGGDENLGVQTIYFYIFVCVNYFSDCIILQTFFFGPLSDLRWLFMGNCSSF